MSYATVIRELGYPIRSSLKGEYDEYVENEDFYKEFKKNINNGCGLIQNSKC